MAKASAHKLSFLEESTPGTTPDNPRWQRLPDTRNTLALNKDTLTSNRLSGNRFPNEPRQGASNIVGDLPCDLSAETYDKFLEGALRGTWSTLSGTDTVEINVDAGGAVAQQEGDTIATTNGVVTVESVDGRLEETVLTYQATGSDVVTTYEFNDATAQVIDGASFVCDTYVDAAETQTLKAADDRHAYSFLREHSDFAGGEKPFLLYAGCEVNTWNLTADANGLALSTFTFLGRSMTGPSTAAPDDSSYKPAIDNQAFDTFSGAMEIDGVEQCIVTNYNLNLSNGLAPRYTVGCADPLSPEVGLSVVDGSLTVYFEDADIYEKYVNDESMSLVLTLADSFGRKRIIRLPNIRLVSGTQVDVSADGSLTLVVNFTAHYDETLQTHLQIDRDDAIAP